MLLKYISHICMSYSSPCILQPEVLPQCGLPLGSLYIYIPFLQNITNDL